MQIVELCNTRYLYNTYICAKQSIIDYECRQCTISDAQRNAGILHFIVVAQRAVICFGYHSKLKEARLIVVEGTLYPLLTRLKNDDLLSYEWVESTQGPPRKYYSLTPQGETFLSGLEAAWEELANTVNHLKNN